MAEESRGWPLFVRPAQSQDRQAVLAFASQAADGPDYIPEVFDGWLAAPDSVFLVGVGSVAGEERPICIARVAMLSATEAWLEGLRVDPLARGIGVATDLQVAELHWASALGARVVRYVTNERNEGSHRVGARHGIRLVSAWRSYVPLEGDDAMSSRQGDVDRRTLAIGPRDAESWWERLSAEPGFEACDRLYESRRWAFQELTQERFEEHVRRGEAVALDERGGAGAGWALAIVEQDSSTGDGDLRLCLVWGTGAGMARLIGALGGPKSMTRVRVPEPEPELLSGATEALTGLGYQRWASTLHLLARDLDPGDLPVIDPARVVLATPPGPAG